MLETDFIKQTCYFASTKQINKIFQVLFSKICFDCPQQFHSHAAALVSRQVSNLVDLDTIGFICCIVLFSFCHSKECEDNFCYFN